jgi:excisionase family DNA binding protein
MNGLETVTLPAKGNPERATLLAAMLVEALATAIGPETLIDAPEAARRLGFHQKTVERMAREGKIPSVRVPGAEGALKFRSRTIDALIQGNEKPFALGSRRKFPSAA